MNECHFKVPGPLYWHGITFTPALISTDMPGKMWDNIANTFPTFKGVKRHRLDSEMDK